MSDFKDNEDFYEVTLKISWANASTGRAAGRVLANSGNSSKGSSKESGLSLLQDPSLFRFQSRFP